MSGNYSSCLDRTAASAPGKGSDLQQQLVLYNSLTRKKEVFKPASAGGQVLMYVVRPPSLLA